MKESRLQRLYLEREENSDDWALSVCASFIVGLSPCICVLPFSTLLKIVIFIVYTIVFSSLWKKYIIAR